jgi:hypothetical protein
MRQSKSCGALIATAVIGLLVLAPLASAQSESALNLTPLKTSMRTQSDSLALVQNVFLEAFPTTNGSCPASASNGCTLRIDVSCLFQDTLFGESESINIDITGKNLPAIDPLATVPIDGVAATNPNWDSRQFTWMQRQIPAGSSFSVTIGIAGSGTAYLRTATLELFKN